MSNHLTNASITDIKIIMPYGDWYIIEKNKKIFIMLLTSIRIMI